MDKRNEILGKITVGLFVGTVALIVYKKYKKMKLEKEAITVDDLGDILASKEEPVADDEEEEVAEDIILSDIPEVGEFELKKGTDPNSEYALEQFINMQTAEFKKGSEQERVLRTLYKHEYEPENSGDRTTYDNLLDIRREFFGEDSKWSGSTTWAELILYYAERLTYDLDNTIEYWTTYILDHLQIDTGTREEDLIDTFYNLNDHEFVNHDSGYFGLFGLDDEAMKVLYNHLLRSMYHKYAFEMEFNAFLNMINNA